MRSCLYSDVLFMLFEVLLSFDGGLFLNSWKRSSSSSSNNMSCSYSICCKNSSSSRSRSSSRRRSSSSSSSSSISGSSSRASFGVLPDRFLRWLFQAERVEVRKCAEDWDILAGMGSGAKAGIAAAGCRSYKKAIQACKRYRRRAQPLARRMGLMI